jgi:hypothetical protein
MGIALQFSASLILPTDRSQNCDLVFVESVAGRLGALSVTGLNKLQDDCGSLRGHGSEFEQPIGGFDSAVFELESLQFENPEQLLYGPALLVPVDDAPPRSCILDLMGCQQIPMQRLDVGWCISFDNIDQSKLDCLRQVGRLGRRPFQHNAAEPQRQVGLSP